ncbi:hypothetical protein LX36DRAFT_108660 [Colletotrichum falcatum]|nr:hypothetical protein LX36DRAFT_108660 [Colletotrichum falcatum]
MAKHNLVRILLVNSPGRRDIHGLVRPLRRDAIAQPSSPKTPSAAAILQSSIRLSQPPTMHLSSTFVTCLGTPSSITNRSLLRAPVPII